MKRAHSLYLLCIYILSKFCIRIADTVEEIHSEFAKRLQLQPGEEYKNENFLANSLVFTELKVLKINIA